MEKINIALAQLERIKALLTGWQQKRAISSIERSIVLNQLAAVYEELISLNITDGGISSNTTGKMATSEAFKEEVSLEAAADAEVRREEKKQPAAEKNLPTEEKQAIAAPRTTQATSAVKQETRDTTARLADKYAGARKYLFENFESHDDSESARLSAIDDINRAIGINDRFLFIKELFNGDKDLFSRTICALNSSSCLDDALMYIHKNFKWNNEDAAVKQLLLLLHRRFK